MTHVSCPLPVTRCWACQTAFFGPGELCPDCAAQRDQVTNEDGTIMEYETFDPYARNESGEGDGND